MPFTIFSPVSSASCTGTKKRNFCDEFIVGNVYNDADITACFQLSGSSYIPKTNYKGALLTTNAASTYYDKSEVNNLSVTTTTPITNYKKITSISYGSANNNTCGTKFAVYKDCV
jgi:hypothetical protein